MTHFDSHIYIKNNRRYLALYDTLKHSYVALRLHASDIEPADPNFSAPEQQFIDYIKHKIEFVHNHQRRVESIIKRYGEC